MSMYLQSTSSTSSSIRTGRPVHRAPLVRPHRVCGQTSPLGTPFVIERRSTTIEKEEEILFCQNKSNRKIWKDPFLVKSRKQKTKHITFRIILIQLIQSVIQFCQFSYQKLTQIMLFTVLFPMYVLCLMLCNTFIFLCLYVCVASAMAK